MRFLCIGLLVAGAAVSVSAQTQKKAAVPRMADGRPDLQGTWDFAQLTPFERPGEFRGKDSITEEEAEEFAQKRIETSDKDRRDGGAAADVERAYNDFWWDFGRRIAKQTSLVVDPPDGRVPALTPAAQKRIADRRNHYDNPEERPLAERCVLGFNSGPPMVPSAYNNNMQLVQTRDRVLILNEMIHSARVVDLSGRPHHPASLRFLTGDSIGRWEGDTLVVDTTNFSTEGGFRGATTGLHLVERFTREGPDALRYDFTADDPQTWTRKWSASIPMVRTAERMFEYACHEGNYALAGVLQGARYQEKQAATYMTDADLMAALKAATAGASGMRTSPVKNDDHYRINVVQRAKGAGAIAHPDGTEVHHIIDGTATLVTGGSIVPGKPAGEGSAATSATIEGGVSRRVAKGDVILIPAGTPHWYKDLDGPITYLEVRFDLPKEK
jgi:mannose-6-phosphate isomerase-like protein (cupin superfamily)